MAVELIGTDDFGRAQYKGLSGDTKPNAEVGSTFIETDTGNKYEYRGAAGWKQRDSGGVAIVTNSLGIAVPNNRQMTALASRQVKTYTVADDVRTVILSVIGVAGDACYVVYDAADDASANYALANGGSGAAGISLRSDIIYFGTPITRSFPISALRRIDALDAIATCDGLMIVGVK